MWYNAYRCRCGFSSSGRAPPCQGGGSEFEPRKPLQKPVALATGSFTMSIRICGYDGIGRHARFRFSCREACRFDPCYPHQEGHPVRGALPGADDSREERARAQRGGSDGRRVYAPAWSPKGSSTTGASSEDSRGSSDLFKREIRFRRGRSTRRAYTQIDPKRRSLVHFFFFCNYSVQPMICGKTFVSRHCEPVTDVTGVAIRIPLTRLNCLNCTKEKRIPTPVLRHWLGMTG